MSMIKVDNLTFSYPTSHDNVFENASFQIDTDWKLGFVGRNGRGKTTFMNLLLGKYDYSGKIHSSVQFDYFPYEVEDKTRCASEIFAEIAPMAEEWELIRELSYLQMEADIEVQRGNFSSWLSNFENMQEFELSKNERLQKDIKRLNQSAQQKGNWSSKAEAEKFGNGPVDRGFISHKASKMMKRSKSIEARQQKAIGEKSGLLKNIARTEHLKLHPVKYHKDILLDVSDIVIHYDDKDVSIEHSFSIRQGDRLFIDGRNGSGKSSLLKLIAGENINYSGKSICMG